MMKMSLKSDRKGQAAIEFLMTYGWMLLVVLIVGALIFSFVDFGSLLPNKVEMKGSLTPIVTDSYAQKDAAPATTGDIAIAFRYIGTKPVKINPEDIHSIKYNLGDTVCDRTNSVITIDNAETTGEVTGEDADPDNGVQFRNGHSGYIKFEGCPGFDVIDAVEGDFKIIVKSSESGLDTPNSGTLRLSTSQ